MISSVLSFFHLYFFSSTHVFPFPLLLIFCFFLFFNLFFSRTSTLSLPSLFLFFYRPADCCTPLREGWWTLERRLMEIESNQKDKAFRVTMQHHLVLLPTARQIGLSLPSFSHFPFFLFFLFLFNFVVIIKNRFYFVFWLCEAFESLREKQRN